MLKYCVGLDICHTNSHKLIFSFQSHSDNPNVPGEEKQSLHTQNEGEMSTVEEGSKESRSFPFFVFSFKAINPFQAPFHAAETLLCCLIIMRKLLYCVNACNNSDCA